MTYIPDLPDMRDSLRHAVISGTNKTLLVTNLVPYRTLISVKTHGMLPLAIVLPLLGKTGNEMANSSQKAGEFSIVLPLFAKRGNEMANK